MEALVARLLETQLGVDLERAGAVFVLVLARCIPLAWLSPWLGYRGTAPWIRAALAIVLALAFTPIALEASPPIAQNLISLASLAVREACIGATFAVAVSVPIFALGWAGELVDHQRGSPVSTTTAFGTLHLGAGVVAFFLLGAHRVALRAFAEGFRHAPAAAGVAEPDLTEFFSGAGRIVALALEMTLAFAAPALVSFVLIELALGLAGRVAPSLRVWVEGLSLRVAAATAVVLIALSAFVPELGSAFASSIRSATEIVETLSRGW